jgi:transcriptional regulator with XRE-family HTH domain
MATRESPAARGRRRGRELTARLIAELRAARVSADLSARRVAETVGWSPSAYRRFEAGQVGATVQDVAIVAAVLGLELSVGVHPVGDGLRDRGHQALVARFRAVVNAAFRVVAEVPLPNPGDRRSWDLLLRLGGQIIGVEVETPIRDVQRLVRHMRERERDGGADCVLLVLADTRANRALLPELLDALGPSFANGPRAVVRALRRGERLPGSGVVLL